MTPPSAQEESADLRQIIESWIRRRFGRRGLVVLSCVFFALGIWWKWNDVKELPGVEPLVGYLTEKSVPKAVPGKFNIAVAHLEGDDKHETERLIRESLAEFPSVVTLSFDRVIATDQGNVEKAEREGHERARALLKASGADVLIWGVVLRQDGKSLPKLYWTPARDVAHFHPAARYQMTDSLSLPIIFWQDLTNVLGLMVATSDAGFASQDGRYTADKLKPFINRVRELLGNSKTEQWDIDTRARVLFILGDALYTYGEQSGEEQPLQDAVTAYREALKERTREKVPLDWAVTQNNLGTALQRLGEREADTARLMEAVTAYREALKESTRERAPLDWAMTQNNLGTALSILGEREPGTGRLTEAVTAYREALEEYTREKAPHYWAATQNNLGNTLTALGKRDPDTARLTEAVTAYREALKENTREKVPLDWAMTQNNLGIALATLGNQDPDTARLTEAVAAYREALQERTREKVPFDWAMTQNNLGNALQLLGDRALDTTRLEEAVSAYDAALLIFRDAKADYAIRVTEGNLRKVQKTIDERKIAKSVDDGKPK